MSATADHAAPRSSAHQATAPAPPDHASTSEATTAACAAHASSPATSAARLGEAGRDRNEQQEDEDTCDDR